MAEERMLSRSGYRAVLRYEDGTTVVLWVPGDDLPDLLRRISLWTVREQPARLNVEYVAV